MAFRQVEKEAEERRKRPNNLSIKEVITIRKIPIGVLFASTIILAISPAYADTYTGSSEAGWVTPSCSVSVAIDTNENKWTFYYSGPWFISTPLPAPFIFFNYHIWDDQGYDHCDGFPFDNSMDLDPEGTITYTDYTNRGVWTHTRVFWSYSVFYWTENVELTVDIYIPNPGGDPPSGGGGGGGGPKCPTLFVWNGTDYIEEGLLDIHADSDITVQHEIQSILALTLDDDVYKLQLRELDNFTSHIDQVKLLAVHDSGEIEECPLINAKHSEEGNVLSELLLSDDIRIDTNPNESIDLKFQAPIGEIENFIFVIEGVNYKTIP